VSTPIDTTTRRLLASVGIHVASYVVVGTILGFPWKVMAFWGVGLGIHLARTVPGLVRHLRGDPQASIAPPAAATVPAAPPASDPYLRDLQHSMAALTRAADEAGVLKEMDIEPIGAAARNVHERRMRLAELVDPSVRRRLEGEHQEAAARAESAKDDRAAEVYEAEQRAITTRLDAMDDAETVADRLRARERTILHEIDAARLDLLRSGLTEQPSASLGRQLRKLHGELEAETEVEERLAQARRTQRARKSEI